MKSLEVSSNGKVQPSGTELSNGYAAHSLVKQRRGIVPLGGATNRMAMALPVSEKLAKATAKQRAEERSNG